LHGRICPPEMKAMQDKLECKDISFPLSEIWFDSFVLVCSILWEDAGGNLAVWSKEESGGGQPHIAEIANAGRRQMEEAPRNEVAPNHIHPFTHPSFAFEFNFQPNPTPTKK
jgi:hypothetical protein